MKFIEKVAGYLDSYVVADNKDGVIKVAQEDGVSPDDLIAYHNLTQGNIFTGENIIQTKTEPEQSDSKLIQLGFTIDKVAQENLPIETIFDKGAELGMDEEDVAFVMDNLRRQMQEAGLAEPQVDEETKEKVAQAISILRNGGIDPKEGFEIALNVDENGHFIDEKVASIASKYNDAQFEKIAEAVELLGGEITPEIAREILAQLQ